MRTKRTIALADDHAIVLTGLKTVLDVLGGYEVVFTAHNGRDFINKLNGIDAPGLAIIDLDMPVINGFELITWLRIHHPTMRPVAFSFSIEQDWVRRAMEDGACAYIHKSPDLNDLRTALDEVSLNGFCHSELVRKCMAVPVSSADCDPMVDGIAIPPREMEFLRYICERRDLTYKQIADFMNVTRSAVNGYFRWYNQHFDIHSRAALLRWGLTKGLFPLA